MLLAFRLPHFASTPHVFTSRSILCLRITVPWKVFILFVPMLCNHVLSLTSLLLYSLYRYSCDTQVSNLGCSVQCQQQ